MTMTRDAAGRGSSVQSVELALDVLEQVAQAEDGIGVSALALRLGFTKGAVHRHLQTLVQRGYLAQDAVSARYRLGLRSALLGKMASGERDLTAVSRAALRRLRDETGETVTLAGISSRSIVVIECILGTASMEIGIKAGSEIPIHATSHGKVALAFSRTLDVEWVKTRKLKAWTPHTLCDWSALDRQVELARKRGWASSPEQMLLGINALSAPVFDQSGDCVAAVALVGSIQYLPAEPKESQLVALRHATQQISRKLGYRP